MIRHTFLLFVCGAIVFSGIGRAREATSLTGSATKTAEAVSKADVIFVGKITDEGKETRLPTTVMYVGTAYQRFRIKVLQGVLGSVGSQTSVTLIVDSKAGEATPAVGSSYIFFAWGNRETHDPFYASKLLPYSPDTIAKVKKMIEATAWAYPWAATLPRSSPARHWSARRKASGCLGYWSASSARSPG